MQNLLTLENVASAPIEEGDAGVILKRDGSFRIFSTGNLDADNLDEQQLDQGRKLNALALALSLPQVMSVLLRMASDPDIVGEAGINFGRCH